MLILALILVSYILFDVNYVLRTFFTMVTGFFQQKYTLKDVSTIYGWCTFQDCDVTFKYIRLARIIRDIDFARYSFYERTGIYRRSKILNVKSLQGCTLTLSTEPVPLFAFYKINTKLIYWDDKSLFFEHEVVTLRDNKVRYLLVSRQHAIGKFGDSTEALLKGIPGVEDKPECPEYIKTWLASFEITSQKLRNLSPSSLDEVPSSGEASAN